jgi:hypothetical protein
MMTRDQLLDSIASEMRIIRHLASKVPSGAMDWRPTPGQRSTIELLRYLSTAAIDLTRMLLSGTWDTAAVTGKAPRTLAPTEFDAAMARQEAAIRDAVGPLSDRDLVERRAVLPTGAIVSLGVALIEIVLKALVAYRMQLFLYAKGSGNSTLATSNLWFGVDSPAPPKDSRSTSAVS